MTQIRIDKIILVSSTTLAQRLYLIIKTAAITALMMASDDTINIESTCIPLKYSITSYLVFIIALSIDALLPIS